MAAMSAAPATATTFASPSSSHGTGDRNGYSWSNGNSSAANDENQMQNKRAAPTNNNYEATNGHSRSPLVSQNGNSNPFSSTGGAVGALRKESAVPSDPFSSGHGAAGAGYLSPQYDLDRPIRPAASVKESSSAADRLVDLYASGNMSTKRPNADLSPIGGDGPDDESSKWIHRDKLARIESEELQAAGIILPGQRARSRPRYHTNGTRRAESVGRSRKNSEAAAGEARGQEIAVPSWDLRLPEEIIESNYWTSKGSSRIPVAKSSPVPIPADYLERETPATRKRDSSPEEGGTIRMPKTRARSSSTSTKLDSPSASAAATSANATAVAHPPPKRAATDVSPKKNPTSSAGARKSSAPGKANGHTGRPKTRGAPSKDSTGSSSGGAATRPSTRSGEREFSPTTARQPEGDPPWMVSAYKPDPRLPPDQQLLPTVARRLQQEKWEREGKFGSIYDKEFRPLTDDGFLAPPEPKNTGGRDEERQADEKEAPRSPQQLHVDSEWPLKTEPRTPTSPNLRQQRTNSYTTIPKIQDPPVSPIPGSRGNAAPLPSPLIRVPDIPAEDPKQEKKGCMCCIVM